nr:hypothetical protein RchiOBHm_Chr6g0263221 [Ipomoea batatas]
MNDMISCPVTASIINSVMGSGKSSFGHATLRSRKSTHTRIWPFFLRTGTMLDIQGGSVVELALLDDMSFSRPSGAQPPLGLTLASLCRGFSGVPRSTSFNSSIAARTPSSNSRGASSASSPSIGISSHRVMWKDDASSP